MENKKDNEVKNRKILGISWNAFIFGFVSMLNDFSSEITVRALPLYLNNVLKTKTSIIGLIEGVADSTATILKIFSGYLSDKLNKRKSLVTLGYTLSAVSKPLLYFANNWFIVLLIRFFDRVGKGIRTSPRDALIANTTDKKELGKAFGFNRAMDPVGAIMGLIIASIIIYITQRNIHTFTQSLFKILVLISIIPVFISVLLIVLFIKDVKTKNPSVNKVDLSLKGFSKKFKLYLLTIAIFTLGNSSDAFLILQAQNKGLSILQIFIMLIFFNLLTTITAFPAGILSDKIKRQNIVVAGWILYAFIYFGFGFASKVEHIVILYILYGLYYGLTEGVEKAIVADLVGSEKRGTAYGLYNGAIGIFAMPSSLIAGLLWQYFGSSAPFIFGGIMAFLASIMLIFVLKMKEAAD
ncbi:MFS transporter [Caldicellulosiruptoraceae bacterium PP1]